VGEARISIALSMTTVTSTPATGVSSTFSLIRTVHC
jgi:hypothetical protein